MSINVKQHDQVTAFAVLFCFISTQFVYSSCIFYIRIQPISLYSKFISPAFNQTQYNMMNMQLLQALFRRHRHRGNQNFKDKHRLREILDQIAPNISERAHQFVQQLFQTNALSRMEPLKWDYDIPNPTQSPMCSSVMTEHSGASSFRCYDCMESSSSCMCQLCFKNGNHQGHNYVQYNSVNGCCDCGNAEAWNEKGFCKTHTAINNLQIELPSSVKAKFIEEGTLLVYIYFYLCLGEQKQEGEEDIYLIEVYGHYIFNYFKNMSHKSYDMKLLSCQLLESKIPAIYPKILKQDLTILQIFFMVPQEKAKAYEELIHFFFELFPVEEHRKSILVNYFKKMKRFDENMIKENPLAGLNFQYLSCVKLIISLIKKGELQPLQVFAAKPYLKANKSIREIPEIYKKLYQDVDYINNMKSAKEYEKLHLMRTNVADFAGYRDYSIAPCSRQNKQYMKDFNVDEMFIKLFAKFVRNLKDQKDVLIKVIQELFHYIVNAKENCASLAQERAFAMLVLTYFQGNISQLASQQKKNQFINSLICTKEQLAMHLKHVIKTSLKTKINISKLDQPHRNQYQSYFIRINCQKNVVQFLDTLFHKILILLSQQVCSYDKVVEELLVEIEAEGRQKQSSEDSDDDQRPLSPLYTRLQNMLVVLELLNTVTRVDMDEILIGGLVKIVNKPKLFAFFARIIATFKQLSVKQIKLLCLELINSEQLFEQFIMNHTFSEKGKLKLKQATKGLEYYNYYKIFKQFSFQLPQTDMTYFTVEEQPTNLYAKLKIINSQTLMNIVDICSNITIDLSQKIDMQTQHVFNTATIQLLKIQINDPDIDKPRLFLEVLLNESMRVFLYKNVVQQVTIISRKEEELHRDLQKIKVEQAEQFRLKREKIMNKRKMKEEIMKKSQQQMLNKFKHIEEMKCEGKDIDRPICIYCKGQKQQEMLSLISYVGLTNLIEKQILKQTTFHYFFSTCGHYIHSSCYIQANTKDIKKHCFLCKQQSNILIPDFITFPQQKTKQKADEFLSNILSVLVNEYQLADGKIGKYQTLIFENNEQILIESFAKQLVYKGLHSYSYFKKNLYFLYLQIYEVIKMVDKQKLAKYLELPSQSEKEVTKLEMLEKYVELKLLDLMPKEDYSFLQISPQEIEQANNIVDVIKNKKPNTEISELKQINVDSLFIKIPETLKQLHMYMGKCKLCPNVTNNIFLCLNCGWSGCLKCSAQIFKHVGDQHLQGTAIMGCSTGSVKYVKQNLIFQDASIYQNYLGLNFTDADSFNEFSRAEKYNLNRQKQQQVKSMMLRYQIHQKIKLNANYL